MKNDSYESALTAIRIEARAVETALEAVPRDAFAHAVDALASCGRITTCASGSSGIAAKKFAHSLCCIERPAQFMPPCEAVHGGLGCVQEGDCVVMVSRGGKTAELLPVIRVVGQKKATLIAVTENLTSPLAESAQIVLPMRIEREADPINAMATASYAATIAIFDALLAAIMTETGYKAAQFAVIHPGGAVGERLNKA